MSDDWSLKGKLKPAKFGVGLRTGYLDSDINILHKKLIEDLADTNKLFMLYAKHAGVFDWDKMIRDIINRRFGV